MFKICLAELNIVIHNNYSFVKDMCKDYIVDDSKTDFEVVATDDEIMAEDDGSGLYIGYLESLAIYRKIAEKLPEYNAFLMHGVVIDVDSLGIVFTARSGVGKTTHSRLWQELLGNKVTVVNGDKPIIRYKDGNPYAYGTPWAGKEEMHKNTRVLISKVCFIERCEYNECLKLEGAKVFYKLFPQVYRPKTQKNMLATIDMVANLIAVNDFYTIKCNMDLSAAKTAYEGLGL